MVMPYEEKQQRIHNKVDQAHWEHNLAAYKPIPALTNYIPQGHVTQRPPKLIAICAENGFGRLQESNILRRNQNEIRAVDQQQRRMQ
jgi:hypothetical protein